MSEFHGSTVSRGSVSHGHKQHGVEGIFENMLLL